MSKNSLRYFVIGISLTCLLALDAFGQCGVYLKRVSSHIFPQPRVFLWGAEDMTGDGITDLLAIGGDGSSALSHRRIFIIPVNADRTLGTPIILESESSQLAFGNLFYVGHVNNDGLKDVVAHIRSNENLRVFLNNGNGTFTAQPYQTGGRGNPWMGLLDVDVDGINDYVGWESGGLRLSTGNGDGTFDAPVTLPISGVASGDFNGDGKVDFISRTILSINNGNGTFTTSDVSAYLTGQPNNVQVRDLNGDGRSDVIADLMSSAGIAVLIRTDTGFNRTEYSLGAGWSGYFRLGNFSGSPALDVVFTDWTSNKKAVFTGDGAGGFARQDYLWKFEGTNLESSSIIMDFDGDGKTDVVQASSTVSNTSPFFADISSFHVRKNVCDALGEPRIVDFDRSGTTDYSFWEESGTIWGYRTSGNLSQPQTQFVTWGSPGDLTVPGDYDGDGITDRTLFRPSTGLWYILRSSDSQWGVVPFGLNGDKPAPADYDGDSISDLAVYRPSTGTWHIWYMGTQQYSAVQFGLSEDKPAPADFDGDLKTDIVVYRPSTGVWYYIRSSNGSVGIDQWGISEDRPIPSDFDGDGRADVAVFRPSSRVLWVRRSYDGGFAGYNWGAAGDIPMVGDWDGDFVADFGQYRPSNGQWWLTSFLFAPTVTFGTSAVRPTSSILRID